MQRRFLMLAGAAACGGLPGLSQAQPVAGAAVDPATLPLWFAFLETGRHTPPDQEAVMAMQRAHIANFQRLFGLGILRGAGPLRDPGRLKRGIVVLRAASLAAMPALFEPDPYVREGHMVLNAQQAVAQPALRTEGIDASGVVEGRIVMLGRPEVAPTAQQALAAQAALRGLVDRGVLGAWYTLAAGPLAEVLFARSTDDSALAAALQAHPGVAEGSVSLAIWPQWLSRGVLP